MFLVLGSTTLYFTLTPQVEYRSLHVDAEDGMQILSNLRVRDIQENITDMIENGYITESDMNKTLLEAIGSFWLSGNRSVAENLTRIALQNIPVCYSLEFEESEIYSNCEDEGETVAIATRMASGYQTNRSELGYVARVWLTGVKSKNSRAFGYFGGYVGDGNITRIINLENLDTVKNATMEMDAGSDFDLYINGNYSGRYIRNGNGVNEWIIPESNYSLFRSGPNLFRFNFTGNDSYIGGGYIKIRYNTTSIDLEDIEEDNTTRYYFPGIEGIINLYTSFYVPGELKSLDLHLHYYSNYTIFVNIGNVTVYENSSDGEITVDIENQTLSQLLENNGIDYEDLNNQNIPVRIGTRNTTSTIETRGADVVLVTDLSGSMEWCSEAECATQTQPGESFCGTTCIYYPEEGPYCEFKDRSWVLPGDGNVCSQRWNSTCPPDDPKKIDIAKNASKLFLESILQHSKNRVGTVEYTDAYDPVLPEGGTCTRRCAFFGLICWNDCPDCITVFNDGIPSSHDLSSNRTELEEHVDNFDTYFGTCICCGVNRAKDMLLSQSNSSRIRAMIVMSDGQATGRCSEQGTGDPKQDAIQAAQEACDLNISVYTVGFGSSADEDTLKQMACNESMYYNATDAEKLAEIYEKIGGELLQISYTTQTVEVSGEVKRNNILFNDSYIEYHYEPVSEQLEYGEIPIELEGERFGGVKSSPQVGWFYVGPDTKVLDAKVTSYSSEF
ncbi:MAG: hypothetical protein DRP11_02050, partial [Candidatus Aenigmatarchaeota archaeon]